MLAQTKNIEVITTSNESEALLLEANLIKKHKPKFNIELNYTDQKNHSDKDIKSIIDYGKIIKVIKNLTENKHYNFLETLADDLFDELFKEERIYKIKLKIEKLDAIREAASVGIEITKNRIYV